MSEADMSEADDGRLYGLMEVAEGQQAVVQAALEGLAAERAALRREREALARQVQAVEGGARAAVRAAVAEGLAGAATEGAADRQKACRLMPDDDGKLLLRQRQRTAACHSAHKELVLGM